MDRLVDPLEHGHPGQLVRRQASADGGAPEHDRDLGVLGAKVADRDLHRVLDLVDRVPHDHQVGMAPGDGLEQVLGREVGVERRAEAGRGELVVDHLQGERVGVAFDACDQDPLAGGLGVGGHVAAEGREHPLDDREGAPLAVLVDLARGPQHGHAPQGRADHLGVQRRGRDPAVDGGCDRLLGALGFAPAERRHEQLERFLHQRHRVGGQPAEPIGSVLLEHFHEGIQQHRVKVRTRAPRASF